MRQVRLLILATAAAVQGAAAAQVGVDATKLIVLDKLAIAGKAKTVLVSKDAVSGVSKGTGTDVDLISAVLDIRYDTGEVVGAFTLPEGTSDGNAGWLVNSSNGAKFVDRTVPDGPQHAKLGLVKSNRLLKLVARGIGAPAMDITGAGAPSGSVLTSYCTYNDGEENCHCSSFDACTWKSIAGDTGSKLVCKGAMPDPTCGAYIDEPTLPTATQACPTIVGGNVDFLGRSIRIWVAPDAALQDGPLIFVWHGLGGSPSTGMVDVMLSAAGRADILAQGGMIAGMRTDPSSTSPFDWLNADFDIADEILACAIDQVGIDTDRIHSVGVSAGGLQTCAMSYTRSGYLASVVSYSGGVVTNDQEPGNKLAAMIVHGGPTDIVIINFKNTSELYYQSLLNRGRFGFICDHGLGHTIPLELGPHAWQFIQDHPFGVRPFPYAKGLPAALPGYCSLGIP